MKTNRQTWKWIIDAGLLIGFLVTFFLDLTGLSLHQWLGVALGVMAGFHIIMHWNWIKCVTKNFAARTSARARSYFVLDAGIMIGFVLIVITGLVISSWLNLSLFNYDIWRNVHVVSSIGTLSMVVLKIGLHWRSIVNKISAVFSKPTAEHYGSASQIPALAAIPLQAVPAAKAVSRRQFLTLMGFVTLAVGLAVSNVVVKKSDVLAEAGTNQITPEATQANLATQSVQQPTQTAQPTAAASTEQVATQVPVVVQPTAAPVASCVARCNKGCSYPGRCRRYSDANGNGKCDLGECL